MTEWLQNSGNHGRVSVPASERVPRRRLRAATICEASNRNEEQGSALSPSLPECPNQLPCSPLVPPAEVTTPQPLTQSFSPSLPPSFLTPIPSPSPPPRVPPPAPSPVTHRLPLLASIPRLRIAIHPCARSFRCWERLALLVLLSPGATATQGAEAVLLSRSTSARHAPREIFCVSSCLWAELRLTSTG